MNSATEREIIKLKTKTKCGLYLGKKDLQICDYTLDMTFLKRQGRDVSEGKSQ